MNMPVMSKMVLTNGLVTLPQTHTISEHSPRLSISVTSNKPSDKFHTDCMSHSDRADVRSVKTEELLGFGYSQMNRHNSLGILEKLDSLEASRNTSPPIKSDMYVTLSSKTHRAYTGFLRKLPSRRQTDALVQIFFAQVNWQYSLLDHNMFVDQLHDFYASLHDIEDGGQSTIPKDVLFLPALLFQVAALAIQFLPLDYNTTFKSISGTEYCELQSSEYSELGVSVSALFDKTCMNLMSIQAGFLRVCWLKNGGRVAESWHALGLVVMDAQQIELHRDNNKVDGAEGQDLCRQLWKMEMRRRVMINLLLWDSQMAMVLGRPMRLNAGDCEIILPLDAATPEDRTSTMPVPRMGSEKPSSFTARLIEYRLHYRLPEIRALEAEGSCPKDYTKVEDLHQHAVDYVRNLPQIYHFDHPDRSFDAECPWLAAQRDYLASSTWYFLLALHRPFIFTVTRSRVEAMKAGLEMLGAQERLFTHLSAVHHKLFILTFLTVEPAVTILAALIAYPSIKEELARRAFHHVELAITRLNIIRHNNALAGAGADAIQNLLNRAQDAGRGPRERHGTDATTTPPFTTNEPSLTAKMPEQQPHLWQIPASKAAAEQLDYASIASAQTSYLPFSTSSPRWENYSQQSEAVTVESCDLGNIASHILPTADLVYNGMLTDRGYFNACQPADFPTDIIYPFDDTMCENPLNPRLFDGCTDNNNRFGDLGSQVPGMPEIL